VAQGIGKAEQGYWIGGAPGFTAYKFVRDWRVAGAILEKFEYAPEAVFDELIPDPSLPRAIIITGLKLLDEWSDCASVQGDQK